MAEDNETYVKNIEKKNGYCGCKELTELFIKNRAIKGLESICEGYREIDLENPKKSDLPKLLEYQQFVDELDKNIKNYNIYLTSLVSDNKLSLTLHKNNSESEKVNINELKELRKNNSIISINCSNCDQQIELVT